MPAIPYRNKLKQKITKLRESIREYNNWLSSGDEATGKNHEKVFLFDLLESFLIDLKELHSSDIDPFEKERLPNPIVLQSLLDDYSDIPENLNNQEFKIKNTDRISHYHVIENSKILRNKISKYSRDLIALLKEKGFKKWFSNLRKRAKINKLSVIIELLAFSKEGLAYLESSYLETSSDIEIFHDDNLQKIVQEIHISEATNSIESFGTCIVLFRDILKKVILPLEGIAIKRSFPNLSAGEKVAYLNRHFDNYFDSLKKSRIRLTNSQKTELFEIIDDLHELINDITNDIIRNHTISYDEYGAFIKDILKYDFETKIALKVKNGKLPDTAIKDLNTSKTDLADFLDGLKYFGTILILAGNYSSFLSKESPTTIDSILFVSSIIETSGLVIEITKKFVFKTQTDAMTRASLILAPVFVLVDLLEAFEALGDKNYRLFIGKLLSISSITMYSILEFSALGGRLVGPYVPWAYAVAFTLAILSIWLSNNSSKDHNKFNDDLKLFFEHNYFGRKWTKVPIKNIPIETGISKMFYGWKTKQKSINSFEEEINIKFKRSLISGFYSILYPLEITNAIKYLERENGTEVFEVKVRIPPIPIIRGDIEFYFKIHSINPDQNSFEFPSLIEDRTMPSPQSIKENDKIIIKARKIDNAWMIVDKKAVINNSNLDHVFEISSPGKYVPISNDSSTLVEVVDYLNLKIRRPLEEPLELVRVRWEQRYAIEVAMRIGFLQEQLFKKNMVDFTEKPAFQDELGEDIFSQHFIVRDAKLLKYGRFGGSTFLFNTDITNLRGR